MMVTVVHTFITVVYRTRISYHTRMVHTVRVRYVPYAYGMLLCTIRVWLYRTRILFSSHSIKLFIGTGLTGGSIPNDYYVQKAMSLIALALHY